MLSIWVSVLSIDPEERQVELETRRLQTEVLLEFSRIAGLVERRVQAGFADQGLAITPAQSRVLMILFQAREPLSQRVISRRMGLAEVTVGRFVKAMEEGGWVDRERDPEDRRCWRVRPTAKAREALPRFIAVSNEVLDALFEDLSPAALAHLHDTLKALRRCVPD